MAGIPLTHHSERYQIAHPAPTATAGRVADDARHAEAAQRQNMAALKASSNLDVWKTEAATNTPPPKPYDPNRGKIIDIRV